ncbi:AAA family ATPase [Schinkia sp. CFF1]
MNLDMKILLINNQSAYTQQLLELLKEFSNVQLASTDEAKNELKKSVPDVVLLVDPPDGSGPELVQRILVQYNEISLLYLTTAQDFMKLRDVTRAGAIDTFIIPDEFSALESQLEKINTIIMKKKDANAEVAVTSTQNLRRGKGKIISFYSGKGGSGKTLLATTFSQTLKFESTSSVIFIDLNLQFGGAETILSVESNRSLVELKPVIAEMNENHIKNVSIKETFSKMELLLSPCDAEVAEELSEEFLIRLLNVCRRAYDFIVLDLPSNMNVHTVTALEESDTIYYVMNLDTPSIRTFKRVEELLRKLRIYTDGRLEVVVNQVSRKNELKVADLKQFINAPIVAQISRDYRGIQSAINMGQPLRKEMHEKKLLRVTKDIKKWVLTKLD